jgi:hypothetical protein
MFQNPLRPTTADIIVAQTSVSSPRKKNRAASLRDDEPPPPNADAQLLAEGDGDQPSRVLELDPSENEAHKPILNYDETRLHQICR